ncbi:hypothetical protein BD413DRAFT_611952 [Trametes elegans]|nr:hypothetical protein BD413DRAFT_611952 [Trametes elegans]
MYSRWLFVLSHVCFSLALSTYHALGPVRCVRDDTPDFTDQDLLNSCPGGPGSDKFEHADRCTLTNVVDNPNTRQFAVLGDPQLNCGGGTDPITVTLGGSHTVTQTNTVNADVGLDIDGLKIGGGASTSTAQASTVSNQVSYTVPPGRQAVYVAGTAQISKTGNIQVNYGDRQYGHFIWFTTATVTQLTPIPDDVQFDVHESACGTNPTDLSSYNS